MDGGRKAQAGAKGRQEEVKALEMEEEAEEMGGKCQMGSTGWEVRELKGFADSTSTDLPSLDFGQPLLLQDRLLAGVRVFDEILRN